MYNNQTTNKDNSHKGYIAVPYIMKPVKTTINGETVWYANKWKNLLLKINHFFVKPKYLKNAHIYKNKVVNSFFYGVVKITGDENKETH